MRNRNFWIGAIALVVLVGLGYIFRPYPGTVAGVESPVPSVPNEASGILSGEVRAPE